MKRLSYDQVRISTIGGVIECKPSTDGWAVAFHPSTDRPRVSHGKSLEEASAQLLSDLKCMINAVEEDLKAFVERNK